VRAQNEYLAEIQKEHEEQRGDGNSSGYEDDIPRNYNHRHRIAFDDDSSSCCSDSSSSCVSSSCSSEVPEEDDDDDKGNAINTSSCNESTFEENIAAQFEDSLEVTER
jgi:hypothetical protein